MRRKDLRHMIVGTAFEDQPIEHTVEQITQRAGKDQPGADNKPAMIFFLDDRLDIVNTKDHGNQAEQRQGHLTPGTAELPAPRHPFVLYKIDLRLITQQLDAIIIRRNVFEIRVCRMAQRHMRLNPDLQTLISNNDQ